MRAAGAFKRIYNQLSVAYAPRLASMWTFDVFDTAITRLVHRPDHLHWLVGRHLKATGLVDIDPNEWRLVRLAAETQARRDNGGDEITLNQVYAIIGRRLSVDAAVATRAMTIEREFEHELVRPVAATRARVSQLRAAGRQTSFITDMYLDSRTIAGLLATCGYETKCGDVFVSSEQRGSKARGDLYASFAASRNQRCRDIFHTGDNLKSDVKNARRAGLAAQWFTAAEPNRFEALLFERAGRNYVASAIAGAARAARLSFEKGESGPGGLVRVSAGVVGPLLTAFVCWLLLQARRDGVNRLYFLARDGQILSQIAQRVAAWAGLGIECRYLLGSRRAFYLPSLPSDPALAIECALSHSIGKRVSELMTELEIDARSSSPILTEHRLNPRELIGTDNLGRLREALSLPSLADVLKERRAERAQALRTYLRAEGVFDRPEAAIVDIGWKGSLQCRLERACREHSDVTFRGYYYDLDARPTDLRGDVATFANGEFRNVELIETFCMANHPSVQGFNLNTEGGATPIIEADHDREALEWGVASQQLAVLRFVEGLLTALPRQLFSPEEILAQLKPAGLAALKLFVTSPSRQEAAIYGSVRHARAQTHEDASEIGPRLSKRALAKAIFSRAYRVRMNVWMPGSLARSQDSIVGKIAAILMLFRQRLRTSS
jgi:FMN phosphatase YigB (HAD superfamily)